MEKAKSVVFVAPRAIVQGLTDALATSGVSVIINIDDNPKCVRIVCAERHQTQMAELIFSLMI